MGSWCKKADQITFLSRSLPSQQDNAGGFSVTVLLSLSHATTCRASQHLMTYLGSPKKIKAK